MDRDGAAVDPPARDGGRGTWFGRPLRRIEDRRLLRGKGRYIGDVDLPGALALAVLRSPHAHARVVGLDATAALRLPGVAAVLDGAAVAARIAPLDTEHWPTPAGILERARPRVRHDRQPILAVDRVRYVGEPVAVVVAADRYQAEDALELIAVEYAPLPHVGDAEEALRAGAPLLHEAWGNNLAVELELALGEVERAFAEAAVVVRERFCSHRYTGVPIETRGVVARPEGGGLTVWSSTQVPHALRDALARLLGLPRERVRVAAPDVGGGFGVKGHIYPEEVLAALLARELGRPVTWVEDRREHFVATIHAREQVHEIELAADREGRLLGLRDDVLFDMGAYNPLGLVLPYNTAAHLFGPYRVPAAHIAVRAAVTNKTPHAPYRGAGRPEAVFALERALERLAAHLELDPAELRLRNLVPAEAMPHDTGLLYRDGAPLVYDSGDYPAQYRRALELIEYDRWRGEQARGRQDRRRLGIGLAGYVEGTGIGPFESGSVTIEPSGRVRVASGICSQGQGHETTFAQLVADVLGVPPEQVDLVAGDTAEIAEGFGTLASRGIVTGGSAVAQAAEDVRDRALRIGAELLEVAAEDVQLADGAVRVVGAPGRAVPLGAVAAAARDRADGGDEASGLAAVVRFEPPTVTYASGVHAAVVAVDADTGRVDVLRYVVVHDCGRVVNPLIADGQMVGGIAQGIGGALLEELVYDEQGQLLTGSLLDYLLPTSEDLPPLLLDHHEHPSPRNSLGLKGLGEGGAIGPPAAIANAIEDALRPLGVVVRGTPLSPNVVRALIRAAED